MKHRQYQHDCFNAIIDGLNRKINPCVSLFTGGGKTYICKLLIDKVLAKGHKALFVVNQINLAEQAGETLKTLNIEGDGRSADWSNKVIIGTIQTLFRNPEKLIEKGVTLIIIDEFHRSYSQMYETLFNYCGQIPRVGLSATVLRGDGKALGDMFHEIVYEKNIHEGISEGFLCEYNIMRPSNIGDMPFTHITYRRKEEEYERVSYNNPNRNEITVHLIKDLILNHGRKKIIVFTNAVDHAEELSRLMGPEFGAAHGGDREDLKRFRAGELTGICSVNLLLEGFDYPPTDCIVVAGTISRDTGVVRATQLIGRSLRLFEGKDNAIILDLSQHGIPDPLLTATLDGEFQEERFDGEEEPEHDEILDIFVDTTQITGKNFVSALRVAKCAIKDARERFSSTLNVIMTKPLNWQFLGTRYRFIEIERGFRLVNGSFTEDFQRFNKMEEYVCSHTDIEKFSHILEDAEPTEAQIRILKRFKFKTKQIDELNRKGASEAISLAFSRQDAEPASNSQKWKLRDMGVEYRHDITKTEARRLIAENVA